MSLRPTQTAQTGVDLDADVWASIVEQAAYCIRHGANPERAFYDALYEHIDVVVTPRVDGVVVGPGDVVDEV